MKMFFKKEEPTKKEIYFKLYVYLTYKDRIECSFSHTCDNMEEAQNLYQDYVEKLTESMGYNKDLFISGVGIRGKNLLHFCVTKPEEI